MARGTSFLGATMRLGRAIAADQRRSQNAAIRQQNAMIRQQKLIARQSEREAKLVERERLAQEKELAIQYALDKTDEAAHKRFELSTVIKSSIKTPIKVNWKALKKNELFQDIPPQEPKLKKLPEEINENDFAPKIGFFEKFFKSKRENKITCAKILLQSARENHAKLVADVNYANEETVRGFVLETEAWEVAKQDFYQAQEEHNASIDELFDRFKNGEEDAIEFFFDQVLLQLALPEEIKLQWQLQYDSCSKILVVDFDLPDLDVIPPLKQMKYVSTRKEFTEAILKEKEVDQLYDDLLLQISLRVTNDLYVSDLNDDLASVVFNGIYNGLSKSTGKEETKCVLSLQTQKDSFLDIDIVRVDPRTCFLKFKGIAGNKLLDFIPIAPVIAMDRIDSRFVEGVDVAGTINGMNLAAMDWESFEHLIRELFEKEFAINGSEVRITQASRDGGVDAVMFDPDPIRGGKYVIQAKRYTNVVGVSAVRDLYGTLMNEGAVKGILVTTANYGADSYEFAKDKPITLINGNNLLHMLQKHGYQARIDIDEAKRLMA